ncbi:MAG: DUF4440 domain-containing protein [Lysobacterales bacterium 14-68-21]|jgi:uncharacterized protein (TIGR02246 family)|nr:MAG: DUF4440 domain-containing protein [Xanthomonadales bacterium 15-68-25]OZB64395.1 MAG: DUF4440 domain-containing protein [Xanthomonadales bacterium 14-68-21]
MHPLLRHVLVVLLLAGTSIPGQAAAAPGDDAASIRQVMADQQAAWNRGDVDGFMRGYKDAPDTTFVGSSVRKGYRQILASYREHYATREQMGRLTFSDLDVRLLPGASGTVRYAVVTGRFHLDRTAHGSVAQDDGVYSLVWEKTPDGWKIILDHSS